MVTISPQCVLHRKMKEFIGTLSTHTRKARTKLQFSEDRSVHAACIPYFLGKALVFEYMIPSTEHS